MTVRELKELVANIPDNYNNNRICTTIEDGDTVRIVPSTVIILPNTQSDQGTFCYVSVTETHKRVTSNAK